jgi:hypothetical protein
MKPDAAPAAVAIISISPLPVAAAIPFDAAGVSALTHAEH